MFQIEKNIPYISNGKERNNALTTEIGQTCLGMKANDSFLITKDKFKKVQDWTNSKSTTQINSYVRKCIKDKIVNSEDYKVQTLESGIRIWYKPKQENILPIQKSIPSFIKTE